MRKSSAALLPLLLVVGCVPAGKTPPPSAAPPARRAPVVPPPQAPLIQPGEDWRDLPLTPGDWHYSAGAAGSSTARFGVGSEDLFSIRCDRASRQVTLSRASRAGGVLVIQTSAGPRTVAATFASGRLAAAFRPSDPFLDAIAFSRGRFTLTSPPDPRLVIPSWPEFARVVEDCRG